MNGANRDYFLRLKDLPAANRSPICITKDAPLEEAVTLMMVNDYSQLPVMPGERTIDGYISWKSIGEAVALNGRCTTVRDCMWEPPVILDETEPLLSAVSTIAEEDFVLVRNSQDRRITGLVTTSDITRHFQELAEPFLLIGQIENSLRLIVDTHFDRKELAACKDAADGRRAVETAADLTFGEYKRLLERKENWQRFEGYQISREIFIEYLEEVRGIRNDVMHFRPGGIAPDRLTRLRSMAEYLKKVGRIGLVKQDSQAGNGPQRFPP